MIHHSMQVCIFIKIVCTFNHQSNRLDDAGFHRLSKISDWLLTRMAFWWHSKPNLFNKFGRTYANLAVAVYYHQFRPRHYQVVGREFAIKLPTICQNMVKQMVIKRPWNLVWGEFPTTTFRVSSIGLNSARSHPQRRAATQLLAKVRCC